MNIKVSNIVDTLFKYGKLPSISCEEQRFMKYLAKDIESSAVSHILYPQEECLFYKYNKPTKWLVLAHIDRIPVEKFNYKKNHTNVVGQLDNVISVAILKEAINVGLPINILFTTKEEILRSCEQIYNIAKDRKYWIIDLDIDVTVKDTEVKSGAISLRDRDCSSMFDSEVVKYLRNLCDINNIKYITKDGDWLVVQVGCSINRYPELRGCYLGLPLDNYHSHREVMNIECINNAWKLLNLLEGEE